MNRLLLVGNAILALVLLVRLLTVPAPVAAAAKAWTAADLRVVADQPARDGRPRHLLLSLGAPAAPQPLPAAPAELGLRAVPPLDLAAFWHGEATLRVHLHGEVAPAVRYRFAFDRPLAAADGRELPAGTAFEWVSPGAAIEQVLIEDDPQAPPGRGDTALRVRLSCAVAPEVAATGLQLAAVDGAPLPTAVEAVPDTGGRVFRLRQPDGDLPEHLDVVLAKGLVPQGGEVGLGAAVHHRVAVFEPLELREVEATRTGLRLAFNRAVAAIAPELLQLDGGKPYRWRATADGLAVDAELAPGELVRIDLAAAFPGRGRMSLGRPVRRTALVADQRPQLDFAGDGEVLSGRAEPVVVLRVCNVAKAKVRLRRVYDNNIVPAAHGLPDHVFAPAPWRDLAFAAPRNQEFEHRLDLRELAGGAVRGLYELEVFHAEAWWGDSRLLQVTDLGVTVRTGDGTAAVQAVSIADGQPLAGAAVEVLTPTNQRLAHGETDAQGLAALRWAALAEDQRPCVVRVRHGDDQVFVDLRRHRVDLADEGLGGRAYAGEAGEALVWPSRGIVRPGERFAAAVLLRDAAGAALAGRELQVQWRSPGGRLQHQQRCQSGEAGLATVEIDLAADAPTGNWWVTALDAEGRELGRADVAVEAFVPNRLEADVAAAGPGQLGAPLPLRVQGNWLEGNPAAGRPVLARVRLVPRPAAPPGLDGFSFAAVGAGPPPGALPPVEAVLDADGRAELRLLLPAAAHQQLTALATAEVLDPSGRVVRAQTEVPVYRQGALLGVQAAPDRLVVATVQPDGAPVDVAAVRVRWERRRWVWRYELRRRDRWEWQVEAEATPLQAATVATAAGRASLPLPAAGTAAPDSWLVAVAELDGVRVEQPLGAAPRAPDRLRVRCAAPAAPGGTALLHIEAPAAGRGFVTLEGRSVHAAFAVALAAGHNEVPLPIPAGLLLPNLHAVVTLTRPAALARPGDGPAWLCGGARVPLRRDDLGLPLQLEAPASVLPESELRLGVVAPGATSAVVAVVDEGVLDVTGHRNPDPLAFLLAPRALAVAGADTGTRLCADLQFAPRAKTGGDGGDDDDLDGLLRAGSINTHIRPLARVVAVALDPAGRGEARVALPPYEGRVRVMAIAAGARQVGAAAAAVVVKGPIGVEVAAPRAAAPGDRFELPVTVRNHLAAAAEFAVELQLGAGLTAAAPAHRVTLPAGGAVTWSAAVAVDEAAAGDVSIGVLVRGGGEQRRVGTVLPVRLVRVPDVEFHAVALGATARLTIDPAFAAAPLRVTARLDAAPDRQLRPALEALLGYPYGCCEQTASKGLALAACAVLLPRLYGPGEAAPPVEPWLQAAVDRLAGMQNHDGGFAWWPGADSSSPFLAVHVADFLLHARDAGADVREAMLARALDRLARALDDRTAEVALRCHAVEVLARAGRVVQPRLDWLCTQALDAEARARLAAALAWLGERQRARAMLFPDPGETVPAAAPGLLGSPLRQLALQLRAGLAIDPAEPQLAAWAASLQRQLLRPQRCTTQDLAQGLRALADHYRRQPAVAAAHGTVVVDGAPVALVPGQALELAVRPGSVAEFAGAGFALVEVRGLRPPQPAADASLTLRRAFVDVDTGAEVAELRRGRVYEVRLVGELDLPRDDLVVIDVLPAGCEAEPAPAGLPAAPPPPADRSDLRVVHRDARDDRVLLFAAAGRPGPVELRHYVRAVFPGDYQLAPLQVQAMYDPLFGVATPSAARLQVRP